MKQETADRINAIYQQLFYDEKYKTVAKDFNDAIARLQQNSEEIPNDLWMASHNYIKANAEYYCTAMVLALNDEP